VTSLILRLLEVTICIERRYGQLAQWLERRFHIPKVTGSNPVLPTISEEKRKWHLRVVTEAGSSALAES
jgi:hypothetical protein